MGIELDGVCTFHVKVLKYFVSPIGESLYNQPPYPVFSPFNQDVEPFHFEDT
jgi:hypothetical protein